MTDRDRTARGEAHGRAVLTEEDVALIRLAGSTHPIHSKKQRIVVRMADLMGVSPSTVWRAMTGQTWDHLPGAVDRG